MASLAEARPGDSSLARQGRWPAKSARSELEEICRKMHMIPETDAAVEYAVEAIESGIMDLEKVEKWLTACEEESWLEEYNRDDNRYNASRGAHLTLKNAESNAEVKGLDVDAARASISTHNSVDPEPPSHAKYRASDSRTEDCPHLW